MGAVHQVSALRLGHGQWSLKLLWDMGLLDDSAALTDLGAHDSLASLAEAMGDERCKHEDHALRRISHYAPVYYATGTHLRCLLCPGHSDLGTSTCGPCGVVSMNLRKTVMQRSTRCAKRAAAGHWGETDRVNWKHMSTVNERVLSINSRVVKQRVATALVNSKRTVKTLVKKLAAAVLAVEEAWMMDDYPLFVRNLMQAHREGMLTVHARAGTNNTDGLLSQSLCDILGGIAKSLLAGTTQNRRMTQNEKLFYAALYNVKGPWAHELIRGVMLGPHLDTTRHFRAELSEGFLPIWKDRGVGNVKAVVDVMKSLDKLFPDLWKAPGVIAEDATVLWRKLEAERLDGKRGGVYLDVCTVRLWGLSGCCTHEYIIHSVQELCDLMAKTTAEDVGCHLYTWVWVPQVRHAPWFPMRIDITSNKFEKQDIFNWWREMDHACFQNGLKLIGHVGDGDARMRASSFWLMRERQNDPEEPWMQHRTGINHKLLDFLQILVTSEGHRKLAFQDPMHLLWRWRRHMLTCKRTMHIGPGLFVNWRHLEGAPHLRGGDLKYTDKQNWAGTQRIFSLDSLQYLQAEMAQDPDNRAYHGTITFIWWGIQLLAMWYHDAELPPLDTIRQAATMLHGILYWRFWVDKREKTQDASALDHYSIKYNFMTRETFLDSVISASTRILVFVLYRLSTMFGTTWHNRQSWPLAALMLLKVNGESHPRLRHKAY